MIKQPPVEQQPISITYSNGGASGWSDLPLGTYRVPNSTVIISGLQSSGIGLAGLFGVLAADAAESAAGGRAVKDAEDALHIDLTQQATSSAQLVLASDRFGQSFVLGPAKSGPVLEVTPFSVLTFVNDQDVQPYLFLRATLKSAPSGSSVWTTRYIASVGKPIPLMGTNSLTANDGTILKATLNTELAHDTAAMLYDVANRPARDDKNLVYVETGVPYLRPDECDGIRDRGRRPVVVFAPKLADAMVFFGGIRG